MATNHSMDQDTRASHSKAQEAQDFWSICPQHFFADFWNVMEDILLNRKPLKNVILQRKKTKQKKGMKRNSQVYLLWQRPAGLMANFYLYHINLT